MSGEDFRVVTIIDTDGRPPRRVLVDMAAVLSKRYKLSAEGEDVCVLEISDGSTIVTKEIIKDAFNQREWERDKP